MSSIAMARIFSPFFRLAALRTFAGITTCPFEETLVVDASTILSSHESKSFLTYNHTVNKDIDVVCLVRAK